MDLKGVDYMRWTGSMWIRVGATGELFYPEV